jgi:hypothetical protein
MDQMNALNTIGNTQEEMWKEFKDHLKDTNNKSDKI